MSAIVPISLTSVTPAFDYQFNPQEINGGISTYLDTVGGIPLGYPRLTASLTRPSKGNKYSRARVRMVVPTLNTPVTGVAPSLAYENFGDVTFTFSELSSLAEREAFKAAFIAALNDVTIQALTVDLEQLY